MNCSPFEMVVFSQPSSTVFSSLLDLSAFGRGERDSERLKEPEDEFFLGREDLRERCTRIDGRSYGGPFDVTDTGTEANGATIGKRFDRAKNQSFGADQSPHARGGRGIDPSRGGKVEFAQYFTQTSPFDEDHALAA